MSKLLQKPLRANLLYALIVLICSIPIYFFVIDHIWMGELDEHNEMIKERIDAHFSNHNFKETNLKEILADWEVLQPGTSLQPTNGVEPSGDTIYTEMSQEKYSSEGEMDRFRVLQTSLLINGKSYILTVKTNVEEADETLMAIAIVTSFFFMILLVGFLILNRTISKRIWIPFQKTLKKLESFDLNNQDKIDFQKTNIEEFEELHGNLHRLISNNVDAFRQQKTFIENASHELQTPLAVLKSKMDTLIQNKELTESQLTIVDEMNLPLARITRINKNLLLLAKIENRQFAESESISIQLVIEENIEMLRDFANEKNIEIQTNFEKDVLVNCNKTLLEIFLNNLIINGIKHNIPKGDLIISLHNETLTIQNTGDEALNSETIFGRFSISKNQAANSGLGLAIVKEICQRYDWNLSYEFENGKHNFGIRF